MGPLATTLSPGARPTFILIAAITWLISTFILGGLYRDRIPKIITLAFSLVSLSLFFVSVDMFTGDTSEPVSAIFRLAGGLGLILLPIPSAKIIIDSYPVVTNGPNPRVHGIAARNRFSRQRSQRSLYQTMNDRQSLSDQYERTALNDPDPDSDRDNEAERDLDREANSETPNTISDRTINQFGRGLYVGVVEWREIPDSAPGSYRLGVVLGVLTKILIVASIGAQAFPF